MPLRPRRLNMASKRPSKPRLSLTKTQIQAGIGAELLALCQSMTEDGSLSKDEIIALRSWLAANRSSDLPAVAFLTGTVEHIIADGKVTKDERRDLYKAIEAVLPPEARKQAAEKRKVAEAREVGLERAQRQEQRRQEQEERERKRPVASANFMVAGVHYEGRPEVIRQYVEDGDHVYLARDPHNRYSRNAVEIRLRNGMQIGFVPEDDAVDLAPLLDQGCPHQAHVTRSSPAGASPSQSCKRTSIVRIRALRAVSFQKMSRRSSSISDPPHVRSGGGQGVSRYYSWWS